MLLVKIILVVGVQVASEAHVSYAHHLSFTMATNSAPGANIPGQGKGRKPRGPMLSSEEKCASLCHSGGLDHQTKSCLPEEAEKFWQLRF